MKKCCQECQKSPNLVTLASTTLYIFSLSFIPSFSFSLRPLLTVFPISFWEIGDQQDNEIWMATNEFLVGSSSKKGKGEDKIEMKGFFFLDRCRLRLVTSLSLVNMYPLDEQKKLFNRQKASDVLTTNSSCLSVRMSLKCSFAKNMLFVRLKAKV